MKMTTLAAILFLLASGLPALDEVDFERVVDISVSLRELAQAVRQPDFDPQSMHRFIIFDGFISSINIIQPEAAEFIAELEIVNGEWIGTDRVVMYKAYVYALGPEFHTRLPLRPPRLASPDLIPINSHVLVVGRLADVHVGNDGRAYPVVLASWLRVLP